MQKNINKGPGSHTSDLLGNPNKPRKGTEKGTEKQKRSRKEQKRRRKGDRFIFYRTLDPANTCFGFRTDSYHRGAEDHVEYAKACR